MSEKERFYWSLGALLVLIALLFLVNIYLDAKQTQYYCNNTPLDQIDMQRCGWRE